MGRRSRLRPVGDPAPAGWVVEGVGAFGSGAGGLVPHGFEAYARILHPAAGADDTPVTWAEVAAWAGRRVHPRAQFQAISAPARDKDIASPRDDRPWADEPEPGTLALRPPRLSHASGKPLRRDHHGHGGPHHPRHRTDRPTAHPARRDERAVLPRHLRRPQHSASVRPGRGCRTGLDQGSTDHGLKRATTRSRQGSSSTSLDGCSAIPIIHSGRLSDRHSTCRTRLASEPTAQHHSAPLVIASPTDLR